MILLPNQPVTTKGDGPSRELVQIIQQLGKRLSQAEATIQAQAAQIATLTGQVATLETTVADQGADIADLTTRLDALETGIAGLPSPTGGTVIDVEARAVIDALRAL